ARHVTYQGRARLLRLSGRAWRHHRDPRDVHAAGVPSWQPLLVAGTAGTIDAVVIGVNWFARWQRGAQRNSEVRLATSDSAAPAMIHSAARIPIWRSNARC